MTASSVTWEQYVKALKQSGLVTTEQLAALLKEYEADPHTKKKDPQAFAEWLEVKDVVTAWQNGKLLQGMYKGFFLGKYKLLKHLGSGGMSSVYLGEHVLMRRRAAIKILPKARVDDSSYLERFFLEARAIAALDHPNIVRAYNLNNDGNLYYIVMEFVQGEDLEKRVIKNGPLPFDEALDYLRQAADGLAHAHERKMIHRDIKPSNLLLDDTGTVKILDMGLAKLTADDRSLTREHNERVLGTTDYLAPEQAIDSSSVDARADIYSLGCTLYFFVTGRPPFPEGTLAQRLMKHQVEEPKPIREMRPDCPQELVDVCAHCMSKRREDRFQSAQDVSDAAADVLQNVFGKSVKRSAAPRPAAPTPSDPTVELRADDTHFGKKGQPRPSGSGPVATADPRAGTVKSGSSTQRAPAAGGSGSQRAAAATAAPVAVAGGSTVKSAAVEPTEIEAMPIVTGPSDSSPSVRSSASYRTRSPAWYTQPTVMIGAGLLALVVMIGVVWAINRPNPKPVKNGDPVPTPDGRVTVKWSSFPIGTDYPLYVRVARPGSYHLILKVYKAAKDTTAKVTMHGNVLADNLPVGNARPNSSVEFELGTHTLTDGDNQVQVSLSKRNDPGAFEFSLIYEPAR